MACNNSSSAKNCKYKYSESVTNQENVNSKEKKLRTNWKDVYKAVGDTKTYTSATFTKKKIVTKYKEVTTKDKYGKKVVKKQAEKYGYEYTHPWTLAGAEFKLNLPSNAIIKTITFIASMRKTDAKATIKKPVAEFRVRGTRKADDNTKGIKTGWYDGTYYYVRTDKTLSTSFDTYYWTMDEDAVKKGNIKTSDINDVFFGVDFHWEDGEWKSDNGSCDVQVKYIRVKVEYDIPDYKIDIHNDYSGKTNATKTDPQVVTKADKVTLVVRCKNDSDAKGSSQKVKLTIPFGAEVGKVSASKGSFNMNTMKWTIPATANLKKSDCQLSVDLYLNKNGLSTFKAKLDDGGSASYNLYVSKKDTMGYNEIDISANGEIRQGTKSCIDIDIHGYSDDTELRIDVTSDPNYFHEGVWSVNNASFSKSEPFWEQPFLENGSDHCVLNITGGEDYTLSLRYCFIPEYNVTTEIGVTTSDSTEWFHETFDVLIAHTYNIHFNKISGLNSFKLVNHRVVSEVETDESIIPCVSDEGDANMIMSDCTLSAKVWEDLDYIGCIPLEQTHFNPKSTFKDTLLNSTYKNKRYMGKKLATDEDISLNVRLRPQQVTTLQGLISMDKPIPINANHKCFEGDSLNHRGWCEIYGVKTEQTGNNPHWYKCDIDVKYLTHNLNTRFKIKKGAKVSDYDSSIPSLLTEVHSSGSPLGAVNTDVLTGESYFITDTDGTYYYAEDYTEDNETVSIEDNVRNSFNIDNKQHITVTTRNPLPHTSVVSFIWSTALIEEYRENDISRIIRLIDKKNSRTVFEYQYDDIKIDEDRVSAEVIYRVLQPNGEYMDYYSPKPIQFRYNPADNTFEEDDVDAIDIDDDIELDETGDAHYGSTVEFTLKNDKLSIVDKGFNGREYSLNNIDLVDGEYYYQVEWINNNDDAETSDVECVFDFIVQETILTSTYAEKFSKLIISPFPVAKKKVLFTREAEEGTIYYYQDDDEEFSYLVEPYYQYMNGTDLVTSDGVSIFNLDYGFKIVYIQNGLVRLGFNRLNGELYLGRYDKGLQDYITVCDFKLEKFDDINVNSITDDKIEIQASDSTFTIYRGHPYIKIKHELEDILIDTVFNRVWAEQVGGNSAVELPAYWDLMNEANLLLPCMTNKPKSDCFEVQSVIHNDRQSTTLEWENFPSTIELSDEITFRLTSNTLPSYNDELDLNDTTCSFGDYTVEYESDGSPYALESTLSNRNVIKDEESATVYTKLVDSVGKGVNNKTVYFYEEYEPFVLTCRADPNIIKSNESATITAKLKDDDGSEIKNNTIYFFERVGE